VEAGNRIDDQLDRAKLDAEVVALKVGRRVLAHDRRSTAAAVELDPCLDRQTGGRDEVGCVRHFDEAAAWLHGLDGLREVGELTGEPGCSNTRAVVAAGLVE